MKNLGICTVLAFGIFVLTGCGHGANGASSSTNSLMVSNNLSVKGMGTNSDWQAEGLDDTNIKTIAIDNLGNEYAGTILGQYTNNSGSWQTITASYPYRDDFSPATTLAVANGTLYMGKQAGYTLWLGNNSWNSLYDTTRFGAINKLKYDGNGNLYIAAESWVLAYNIPSGFLQPITEASNAPQGKVYSLTTDANGNVYAGDALNNVYEFNVSNGNWSTLGSGTNYASILAYNNVTESLYALPYGGTVINVYASVGQSSTISTPCGLQARGAPIQDMALDGSGNLFIGCNTNREKFLYVQVNESWARITGGESDGSLGASYDYNDLLAVNNNGKLLTALGSGVYTHKYWNMLAGRESGTLDTSNIQTEVLDNNGILYAGTQNGNVFAYQNGSWNLLSGAQVDGGQINALIVDSNNNLYAATGNGNVCQYNGGSWIQLGSNNVTCLAASNGNTPSFPTQVNTLAINSANTIYAGTQGANQQGGSVYQYQNESWVTLTQPPVNVAINELAVDESGNLYAGMDATTTNMYELPAGANTWVPLAIPDTSAINAVQVGQNSNLYIGTQAGNIFQYSSGSWSQLSNPPGESGVNIRSMVVDNANNVYIGTDLGHVWKYSNGTWTIAFGSAQNATLDGSSLWTLILYNTGNNSILYAGTQNGNIFKYGF